MNPLIGVNSRILFNGESLNIHRSFSQASAVATDGLFRDYNNILPRCFSFRFNVSRRKVKQASVRQWFACKAWTIFRRK